MSYSLFELLDHSKPILVFGRDGQVGRALEVCLKDLKTPVVFLGRSDCDFSNELSIRDVLNRYQPQVIINAAAYTAVDKAESANQRELAFAINAMAPKIMAQYAASVPHGILVHYSTDYVFSDTKTTAYLETDGVGPVDQLCIYGQSKLAGELAIKEAFDLNACSALSASSDLSDGLDSLDVGEADQQLSVSRYFILRTSWVYGDGGNFIRTMLRLACERDQLKVVADQVGAPTSAQWLAEVSIQMAGSSVKSGIFHTVPDGEVSWHGLAVFAIETAASCCEGIEVKSENILPILTTDYPVPAARPSNSRLNNQKLKKALSEMAFKGQYPHWRDQVEMYVKQQVDESLKS
jgi:dTDP-4-dehydrorhamnose reductase